MSREQAIADLRQMRQTHEEWLRHVTPGPNGNERCPECAEGNVAAIVGDADHHKDCIAKYDNALAVLTEVQDRVEVTEEMVEAAQEAAEDASVYSDLDPEYVRPMVVAALEAALATTHKEDQDGD